MEEGILGHPVCQPSCSPANVGAVAVAVCRRGLSVQREALADPAAAAVCCQELHMLSIDALQAVKCSAVVWRIAAHAAAQFHPGCRPADAGLMAIAIHSRVHSI